MSLALDTVMPLGFSRSGDFTCALHCIFCCLLFCFVFLRGERKQFIWRILPYNCLSSKEVGTGAQIGQEPGGGS